MPAPLIAYDLMPVKVIEPKRLGWLHLSYEERYRRHMIAILARHYGYTIGQFESIMTILDVDTMKMADTINTVSSICTKLEERT